MRFGQSFLPQPSWRAAPQLVVIVALLVRRALRDALPADVQVGRAQVHEGE
jgi:hypothetical protein